MYTIYIHLHPSTSIYIHLHPPTSIYIHLCLRCTMTRRSSQSLTHLAHFLLGVDQLHLQLPSLRNCAPCLLIFLVADVINLQLQSVSNSGPWPPAVCFDQHLRAQSLSLSPSLCLYLCVLQKKCVAFCWGISGIHGDTKPQR